MIAETQFGRLELVEETHQYLLDGVRKPGVTTILSDEGLWYNPNASPGNAALGTALHRGARVVAEGRLDREKTHPDLLPRLDIFAAFLNMTGFQPVMWEQLVYSNIYQYAGCFDLLGRMRDGSMWLIDIKSNVPPQYADLQLALYEQAARECGIIDPSQPVKRFTLALMEARGNVRIPAKPGDSRSLAIGLSAVTLWHYRREKNLLRAEIKNGDHSNA